MDGPGQQSSHPRETQSSSVPPRFPLSGHGHIRTHSGGGGGDSSETNPNPNLNYSPEIQFLQDQNQMNGTFYNAGSGLPPPPGFSMQNMQNIQMQGGMQGYHYPPLLLNNQIPPNFYPVSPPPHHPQHVPVYDNFGTGLGLESGYQNFPQVSQHHGQSPTAFGDQHQQNQHLYNNNITTPLNSFGLDFDKSIRTVSSPLNSNINSTFATTTEKKSSANGVIKPLIDNIVGSMISNGTYTHFGPSGGGLSSMSTLPSSALEFSRSRFDSSSNSVGENNICDAFAVASMFENNLNGNYNSNSNDMKEMIRKDSPGIANTNTTNAHIAGISGRASTPSDGTDSGSRPQTPNKPSYSEILAKNASQNSPIEKPPRKPTSTPTPTVLSAATATSAQLQNKPSTKENQHIFRKTDSISSASSSSATSSSCASSSSSPVAKQKSFSQNFVGRLFNTSVGKENSNISNSNSYARTPTTTPTHQRRNVVSYPNTTTNTKSEDRDRKILSTQIGNSKDSKQKPKAGKATTNSTNSINPSVFDNLESQDGWTTFTRKNTHRSSISSGSVSNSNKNSFSEMDKAEDNSDVENNDDSTQGDSRRESLTEKKSGASASGSGSIYAASASSTSSGTGSQSQVYSKKGREKDKPKPRKDGRNCTVRKMERIGYLWAATMISAVAWLLKLVTDVFTLSVSVGSTLMEDLYSWWMNKAVPVCSQQLHTIEDKIRASYRKLKQALSVSSWRLPFRRKSDERNSELKKNSDDLLAALGPDRNITLPTNGDEALKRLLSCKGQDPYSILGVRSDSSDETIRRYYKKQAVLVHPDKNLVVGAEEAFKILARAFELVGEPLKRQEYHNKLLEAHAKEQVYGEIGKLLEQLRKKMEIASSSIRCTKCNLRHKKNKTDRPLFAARFCAQCNIHHGAREGELWAEKKGWFGISWNYFTCMDSHIWEINEWAKCQKKNLQHIKADSHCVMYRLVAGGGQSGHSHPNGNSHGQEGQFNMDAEDDWDSLINNLCKTGGVPGSKPGTHFYQQGKGSNGNTANSSAPNTSNGSAAGRKRKGKRK